MNKQLFQIAISCFIALMISSIVQASCDCSNASLESIIENPPGSGIWEASFEICVGGDNCPGGSFGSTSSLRISITGATVTGFSPASIAGTDGNAAGSIGFGGSFVQWQSASPFVEVAGVNQECFPGLTLTLDAYPSFWSSAEHESGNCPDTNTPPGQFGGSFPELCQVDVGTLNTSGPITLCYDNDNNGQPDFESLSNTGFIPPPGPDPCLAWGLWLADDPLGVHTEPTGSAPNDDDLTDDANYVGVYTGVLGENPDLPTLANGATYYVAPITLSDCAALSFDPSCVQIGEAIEVYFVPEIELTYEVRCIDPTAGTLAVGFAIAGGDGLVNGAGFTVSNNGDGTASETTTGNPGLPAVFDIPDGGTVDVTFTDDAGCTASVLLNLDASDYCDDSSCEADVGNIEVTHLVDGVAQPGSGVNAQGPFVVCFDDILDLATQGDYVPAPGASAVADGLYYTFANAAPSGSIISDPAFVGVAWTGDSYEIVNDGRSVIDILINCFSAGIVNNTVWIVPFTPDTNTGGWAVDNNNDDCWDEGAPIQVTFLNTISVVPLLNCFGVSLEIEGGFPEFFGGTYSISNTGLGTLESGVAGSGESILIDGLADGDSWSIEISDANGCTQSFSGIYSYPSPDENPTFSGLDAGYCVGLAAEENLIPISGNPLPGTADPSAYFTMEFTLDGLPTQTTWEVSDASGGLLDSGGFTGAQAGNFVSIQAGPYDAADAPFEFCIIDSNGQDTCTPTPGSTTQVVGQFTVTDNNSGYSESVAGDTWTGSSCISMTAPPPAVITAEFVGPGVSGNDGAGNAVFDPFIAGVGNHMIVYITTYDGSCEYSSIPFDVQVYPSPDLDPIEDITGCGVSYDASGIELTGSAIAAASFDFYAGAGCSGLPLADLSDLAGGTYSAQAANFNPGGVICADCEDFLIDFFPEPDLVAPTEAAASCDEYLLSDFVPEDAAMVDPAEITLSYWTDDPASSGVEITGADLTVTDSGTYWVLSESVSGQCFDSVAFDVELTSTPPAPTAESPEPDCAFAPVQLTAAASNGSSQLFWYSDFPGTLDPAFEIGVGASLDLGEPFIDLSIPTSSPISFWVAEILNGCPSEPTEVFVEVLNCSCPEADTEASGAQFFCDNDIDLDLDLGGGTGLLVDPTAIGLDLNDDNVDGVDWFETTTPAIGDIPYVPGSFSSSDPCNPATLNLQAFLRCDQLGDGFDGGPDDSYVPAGSIDVVVYMPLTEPVIEEQGECEVTLTDDCPETYNFVYTSDVESGGGASFTALPGSSGEVIFEIGYADIFGAAACLPVFVTGNYDCAEACPVLDDVLIDATEVCDGQEFEVEAIVDNEEGATILWTYPDGSTSDLFFNQISLQSQSGCEEEQEIQYSITCDDDGSLIGEGTLSLTVYVPISAETQAEGNCLAQISMECPEFSSSWVDQEGQSGDGFNYNATTATAGNVTFTVTHEDTPDCLSAETFTLAYNCEADCPTVATEVDGATDLCLGTAVELSLDVNEPDKASIEWTLVADDSVLSTDFSFSEVLGDIEACFQTIEIAYEVICLDDGNVISTGIVPVNLYPDIAVEPDGAACTISIDANCPEFEISWETDSEFGAGNSYTAQPNTESEVTFTVINPDFDSGSSCGIFEITLPLICEANCPSLLEATVSETAVCDLGTVAFSVEVSDPDLATIEWTLPDGSNSDQWQVTDYEVSLDGGCSNTLNASYLITCNENDENTIAGDVEVLVHAPANAEPVNGDCVASLTAACPEFEITWDDGTETGIGSTYNAETATQGTVNFTITNPDADVSLSCATASFDASYDCDAVCPAFTGADISQTAICLGETLELTADLDNVSLAAITWALPDGMTSSDLIVEYTPTTALACPETQTIELLIICLDDQSIITDQTFEYTVFPVPGFVVETEDECLAIIGLDCEAYVVDWVDDLGESGTGVEYAAVEGTAGTVAFTIENPTAPAACNQTETILTYDCPSECPIFVSDSIDLTEVCEGETIAVAVEVDDSDLAEIVWTFPDGSTDTAFNSSYLVSSQTGCSEGQEISYEVFCIGDQSIVATGVLQFNVYPDFNAELSGTACAISLSVPICFDLEVTYDIVFDDLTTDQGNGNVYNASSGTAGSIEFTISNMSAPDLACGSTTLNTTFDCAAECPQYQGALAFVPELCPGESTDLVVDVVDEDLGTVTWTHPDGTTEEGYTIPVFPVSASGCTEQVAYAYELVCNDDQNVLASGELIVTIFPELSLSVEDGSCGLTAIPEIDCDEFSISWDDGTIQGESPNYEAATNTAGSVTFTLQNDFAAANAPDDCSFATATASYDCQANCPGFSDASISLSEVCNGTEVILTAGVTSPELGIFEWTLPDGSMDVGTAISYQATTTESCADQQTISYTLSCAEDNSLIASGELQLNVFPAITATVSESDCFASVSQDCVEYEISWVTSTGLSGVGPISDNVLPGESGTIDFTVTNPIAPADCATEVFQANLDCPEDCPSFLSADISVDQVCNGSQIDLSAEVSDQSQASIVWTLPDGSTANTFSTSFEASLPAGLSCAETQTIGYIISCMDASQTLVSEGELSFTVYPEIITSETAGGCIASVSADCQEFNSTWDDGTDSGSGFVYNAVQGTDGTVDFTITQDAPAECASATYSVAYDCQANCPELVSVDAPEPVQCQDGQVSFQVNVSDEALGELTWTLPDGTTSTGYLLANLPLEATDCQETFTISYVLTCLADNSIVATESFEITVFAPISGAISYLDCALSLSEDCAGYTATWDDGQNTGTGFDYTGEAGQSGTVNWTVSNNTAPADCNTNTFSAIIDCGDCPSVTSFVAGEQFFCTQDLTELSDAVTGLVYEAPEDPIQINTFYAIDALGQTEFVPGSIESADDCQVVQQEVYAFLQCDLDGDGFDGGDDDSLIPAGSITVTVYPDLVLQQVTGGDCTAAISGDCGYTVNYNVLTDGDTPAGVGTEVTVTDGESGNVIFTVSDDDPNRPDDCNDQTIIIAVDCDDIVVPCPSSDSPDTEDHLCAGAIPAEPSLNIIDDNTLPIQWFADISDIMDPQGPIDWSVPLDYPTAGDGCNALPIQVFALMQCQTPTGVTIWVDLEVMHTAFIYPEIQATVTPGGCIAQLNQDCDFEVSWEYDNGSVSTGSGNEVEATTLGESGSVTFTLSSNDANWPQSCNSASFETAIDCPAVLCPTTDDLSGAEAICDGEAATLPALNINDDNGNTVEWFQVITDPQNPAEPYTEGTAISYDGNGCDPITIQLFAYIGCDTDGDQNTADEYISLAYTHSINIYPDIIFETGTEACEVLITSDCTYDINYTISGGTLDGQTGNNAQIILNAGDAGTVNFTIQQSDVNAPTGCNSEDFELSFNCPALDCPSTEDPDFEEYVCDETAIALAAPALFNDNQAAIEWYTDISDLQNPIGLFNDADLALYPPTGNGCDPEELVLNAVIPCDDDGDTNTPDVYINLAYTHTVWIYPALQYTEVAGSCTASISSDCDYEITHTVSSNGPNDGSTGAADSAQFEQGESGILSFTITDSDPNRPPECPGTVVVDIIVDCPACVPAADPIGTDQSYCEGAAIPSLNVQETGDTFIWSSDAAGSDTLAIAASYSPDLAGVYYVQAYSALDECPGLNSLPIELITLPQPDPNFSYASNTYCSDEGIVLPESIAETGGSFTITDDLAIDPITGALDLSLLPAGTYDIQYSFAGDCPASSPDFTISVIEIPTASLTAPTSICIGDVVSVEPSGTATADANITWNTDGASLISGDLNQLSTQELSWDTPGIYSVSLALDEAGCQAQAMLNIEVSELTVEASGGGTVFIGSAIDLNAEVYSSNTDYSLSWSPDTGLTCTDCANPSAAPQETTVYTVTATDTAGCVDTDQVTVIVQTDVIVNVANAFSPNGDGMNDSFRIIANPAVLSGELNVYDRWGVLMYTTTDVSIGWDGTYKGEAAQLGTYVYYAKMILATGEEFDTKGNVTLVR